MLTDMINDVLEAETAEDLLKAYRALEKVGVDRATARVLANILRKEQQKEKLKALQK